MQDNVEKLGRELLKEIAEDLVGQGDREEKSRSVAKMVEDYKRSRVKEFDDAELEAFYDDLYGSIRRQQWVLIIYGIVLIALFLFAFLD